MVSQAIYYLIFLSADVRFLNHPPHKPSHGGLKAKVTRYYLRKSAKAVHDIRIK